MLLKDLIVYPAEGTFLLPLESEGNFIKEYSVPGYTFEVTVRTFFTRSYFTIKLLDDYLAVNNIAKLRTNLVYAPILTLENKQHVFYLDTNDPAITEANHHDFGIKINLYYTQEPYYDKYYLERLHHPLHDI